MCTTLFLDLNSYFASCEQQLRPEIRDKPVAVVPVMTESTSVVAASYEAKAFGVKTGVKVGDAVKMCPGLILILARHEEYIRFHHKILAAIDNCVPVHTVHSVDELSCQLLDREQPPAYAIDLAHRIKREILTKVGVCLRCSIGLATNVALAKIATDMQKPDGLVCIPKSELPGSLFKLDEDTPRHPIVAGVTLLNLLPYEGLTGSLFVEDRRRGALNSALDGLNLKYGSGTVHPASMFGAVDAAPLRIAFKSVPNLELG